MIIYHSIFTNDPSKNSSDLVIKIKVGIHGETLQVCLEHLDLLHEIIITDTVTRLAAKIVLLNTVNVHQVIITIKYESRIRVPGKDYDAIVRDKENLIKQLKTL